MSLYEELDSRDILTRLEPLFKKGRLRINSSTCKIEYDKFLPWKTPWVYHNHHPETNCLFWNEFLFDHFKKDMGNPPSGCQSCWKVVVKMNTVEQLITMKDWQKNEEGSCKCGIEVRSYVHGLYGAYFYSRSQEEGLRTLARIREYVYGEFGDDIPVYLKRGCTEMEDAFPNSHLWEVTPQVEHWESLINFWIPYDNIKVRQVPFVEDYVVKKWIVFAYTHGDETYTKYTDGKLLFPPCVTYEDEENG